MSRNSPTTDIHDLLSKYAREAMYKLRTAGAALNRLSQMLPYVVCRINTTTIAQDSLVANNGHNIKCIGLAKTLATQSLPPPELKD